ncbi:MAG: hypothetical protein BGO39_16955 [Chloroflexi bacterium 54-19]|nr:MAG: hypothetical protein BGO39_16955 [Chloroflexi bacterium 54-19]
MRVKVKYWSQLPKNISRILVLLLITSVLFLAACGDFTPTSISSVPSQLAALSSPSPSSLANLPATSPAVAPTTIVTVTVSTSPATATTQVSPGPSSGTPPTGAVSPAVKTLTPEQAVDKINSPAPVSSNQAENEATNNLKTYYAALASQDYSTAYNLVIRPNRGVDDQLEFTQEHQTDTSIQNLTDLKAVQSNPAKSNLVFQITIHFFPKQPDATPIPDKNIPLTGDNVRYVEMVKEGGIWRIAQIVASPITDENSFATIQARPPVIQQILDFSFINSNQGWAAGSYCTPFGYCQVVVKMTTDGGRSWQARTPVSAEPTYFMDETSNHKKVGGIYFVSASDGWLFGPGLFSTHNGGASWQDEKFSEDVIELTSAGSKILAVTRTCPQPPNGTNCKYGLLSSSDKGHTWQKMPELPTIPGPAAQLLTSTANDFWLLSWGTAFDPSDKTPPAPTMAVTHDGGKSWQTLTNPCQEDNWINARLSANSQEFWLLCASTPATAQQLKYLYLSRDGGKTWQEIGAKEGTVSGYNSSFATSGPGKLWLASTRYTLMTSSDGGQNWKMAIPLEVLNPGDGGVGPVKFVDATHGWVGGAQGQIFLTNDGGTTWTSVSLN